MLTVSIATRYSPMGRVSKSAKPVASVSRVASVSLLRWLSSATRAPAKAVSAGDAAPLPSRSRKTSTPICPVGKGPKVTSSPALVQAAGRTRAESRARRPKREAWRIS